VSARTCVEAETFIRKPQLVVLTRPGREPSLRVMPMKIEILRERVNRPLGRKEIHFRIDHVGSTTPSRADVKAKIAAQFDADPSTVVIKTLRTAFGVGVTEGSARIYDSPDLVQRIENPYILKRHEAKKAAEA